MDTSPKTKRSPLNRIPPVGTTVVTITVIAFWVIAGFETVGVRIPFARVFVSLLLLTVIPGSVFLALLDFDDFGVGEWTIYATGLSLAMLSTLVVIVSVVGPLVGFNRPLSYLPFGVVLTAVLIGMATLGSIKDNGPTMSSPEVHLEDSLEVIGAVGVVLGLSIGGASLMNTTGSNAGTYLFVLSAVGLVLLTATRFVRPRDYPVVVVGLSLSTFFHRALPADHVVGADVQLEYYLASHVLDLNRWSTATGDSLLALPMVTAVSATYSAVTGLDLVTVFTVVYILVVSLVPLCLFYVAREIFDDGVALYGSIFFLFYHVTFYFTPGKQLLSQLFLLLLILLFLKEGLDDRATSVAAIVLAVGVVHSHYGTTLVFGIAAFVAALVLVVIDRFLGPVDHGLSPIYPVAFLAGGVAWYVATSSELTARLLEQPPSLARQLLSLPGGVIVGSGSSFVQQQTALLEFVTLAIYVLCTALVGLGLAWHAISHLQRIMRGEPANHVAFSAIAVPLVGFLGLSFLVVVELHADRAYQLVLPVLAPYLAVGFSLLYGGYTALTSFSRAGLRSSCEEFRAYLARGRPHYGMLAALLVALFVLNSGLAFAAVGVESDYTFDTNANDYAFSEEERIAVEWLKNEADVEPVHPDGSATDPDTVRIYTDTQSYQLFRSIVPEGHYDVAVIPMKDRWDPRFDPYETDNAYVFIRHRAVVDEDPADVPVEYISSETASAIIDERKVVFENDDATIVEPVSEE